MTTDNDFKNKGYERERSLGKSAYYSNEYFQLGQLCAFAHQIHDIHTLNPKSILEVGIGNGFTSSFLKRAGFNIITVDINPDLEPDVCASIMEIKDIFKHRCFDLVVCCEVLEHIPFGNFNENIKIFSSIGQRLYLTLPNFNKSFGFSGFLRLPRKCPFVLDMQFDFHKQKPLGKAHFWEVNSSSETNKKAILKAIRQFYKDVEFKRNVLSPNHLAFYASNEETHA